MRARLRGLGRVPWAAVTEELATMTCSWADLEGWHVEAAPGRAPVATHLWGWSGPRWARVRVDGDEAIVGILDMDHGADGEEVSVTRQHSVLWDVDDPRIPATSLHWLGMTVTLLIVEGLRPVTFVECARPPSDGGSVAQGSDG